MAQPRHLAAAILSLVGWVQIASAATIVIQRPITGIDHTFVAGQNVDTLLYDRPGLTADDAGAGHCDFWSARSCSFC